MTALTSDCSPPLLAITWGRSHLSFVETSLRTDNIWVPRVDGQEVRPFHLSIRDLSDPELSHAYHLPEKVLGAHHPNDEGARAKMPANE